MEISMKKKKAIVMLFYFMKDKLRNLNKLLINIKLSFVGHFLAKKEL